jgi:intein/homing endonuclease
MNTLLAAKYIGAGLATIGLGGAGVNNNCPPNMKILGNKLTLNGKTLHIKVNTVDKKYSKVFLAWLAGFFEGDGSILCYVDRAKGYKFKFRIRVIIKLSQKSNKVLDEIRKDLELRNVMLNRRKDSKLNYFDLIIANQNDVLLFINLIKPYVRFKHNQLEIAITILSKRRFIASEKDLLQLAKLADSLSILNIRSNNDGKKYTTMIKEYFNL